MNRITKRDIVFFILGFVIFLAIDIITNWKSAKEEIKKGFNETYERE